MELIWFCAKGYSFFAGIALLVISSIISFAQIVKLQFKFLIFLFVVLGVVFIYMASIPKSLLFYFLWFVFFLFWFFCVLFNIKNKIFKYSTALFLLICIIAFITEIKYTISPTFEVRGKKIYLIGDSFSAGIDSRNGLNWPRLLKNQGYNLTDLSMSGATVSSAQNQLDKISDKNCYVILEIGGNDFFYKTPLKKFESDYEYIIKRLIDRKCEIIMLELPSFPWQISHARIQRKLANKYNINMIPKRFFIEAISYPGANSDLVHLTSTGHKKMATIMTEFLIK